MTLDREKVVERLGKVSYYFKSLLAVGWQGDADIYREHRESVNMAIALLKEQEAIIRCKDCKHFLADKTCGNPRLCDQEDISTSGPDWFCADGERADME